MKLGCIENTKSGISLKTLLEFTELKIKVLRKLGHPFSVTWDLRTDVYNCGGSNLKFKQVWKEDGIQEDVFSKNKIDIKEVQDTIVSDIEVAHEYCEYDTQPYPHYAKGSIIFKNTDDFYLELPLCFLATPTIVYYKYAICKDESFKELYEKVFNG